MGRARYQPRQLRVSTTVPFDSAEAAWLWYAHCQLARLAGCRPRADLGDIDRPCDPDDIHRAVMRLSRQGTLSPRHVRVLAELGTLIAGAQDTVSWTDAQDHLWRQSLDKLEVELRAKGIVA